MGKVNKGRGDFRPRDGSMVKVINGAANGSGPAGIFIDFSGFSKNGAISMTKAMGIGATLGFAAEWFTLGLDAGATTLLGTIGGGLVVGVDWLCGDEWLFIFFPWKVV